MGRCRVFLLMFIGKEFVIDSVVLSWVPHLGLIFTVLATDTLKNSPLYGINSKGAGQVSHCKAAHVTFFVYKKNLNQTVSKTSNLWILPKSE